MARFAVILPAAGQSTRFGAAEKKVFSELDGRAVWLRAIEPFVNRDDVAQLIIAIAPGDRELFERRYRPNVAFHHIAVVEGGAERYESIANALAVVEAQCTHVAVHDAARPCITPELIDAVFHAAIEHGAALPGLPISDTIKRVDEQAMSLETIPRAGLMTVQTPQAFRRELIARAYEDRARLPHATDDAQLVEASGVRCKVVAGSAFNIKITTRDDLALASAILRARPKSLDPRPIHPFQDERAGWGDVPKRSASELFGNDD